MGFIVSANRDRDDYQVALAFAEAGTLDCFVTDYYEGSLPFSIPTLEHRKIEGIPPELTRSSLRALIRQLPYEAGRRISPRDFPSLAVESALGKTAADVARRSPQSDMLLYSGSALAAFQSKSAGRRLLFQYHPSPSFIEKSILTLDEMQDSGEWIKEAEINSPTLEAHHRAEVELAEKFICASSFTRRGLLEVGVNPVDVSVVPYGCPVPAELEPLNPSQTCKFLFVGAGTQRKGLHLLLTAWRRAALPNATLTVVAARMDSAIAELAEGSESVRLMGRVSDQELAHLMGESDTFVLPSLVEGFGLVLGEALGRGARLIGSTNTGLVDLDLPSELKFVVEAGRVDPLVEALRSAHASYSPDRPYRELAYHSALENSWSRFREGIRQAAQ